MHKIWRLFLLFVFIPNMSWAEESNASPGAYYELKPSIVSNLSGGPKFIRTDIQLLTREDNLEDVRLHAPALRHELLMLLSDLDGQALLTPNGKEAFRQSALAALQQSLKTRTGKNSIMLEDLYFTSFYVK